LLASNLPSASFCLSQTTCRLTINLMSNSKSVFYRSSLWFFSGQCLEHDEQIPLPLPSTPNLLKNTGTRLCIHVFRLQFVFIIPLILEKSGRIRSEFHANFRDKVNWHKKFALGATIKLAHKFSMLLLKNPRFC
jgi:hypothetical protein